MMAENDPNMYSFDMLMVFFTLYTSSQHQSLKCKIWFEMAQNYQSGAKVVYSTREPAKAVYLTTIVTCLMAMQRVSENRKKLKKHE